jgi:hypothetical protein
MNDAKIYYAARIEGDGGAAEIDGVHVVLEEDYDALSHRCDKLREALEKMLDPEKAGVVTYEIGVMQDIARAALAEGGQDD